MRCSILLNINSTSSYCRLKLNIPNIKLKINLYLLVFKLIFSFFSFLDVLFSRWFLFFFIRFYITVWWQNCIHTYCSVHCPGLNVSWSLLSKFYIQTSIYLVVTVVVVRDPMLHLTILTTLLKSCDVTRFTHTVNCPLMDGNKSSLLYSAVLSPQPLLQQGQSSSSPHPLSILSQPPCCTFLHTPCSPLGPSQSWKTPSAHTSFASSPLSDPHTQSCMLTLPLLLLPTSLCLPWPRRLTLGSFTLTPAGQSGEEVGGGGEGNKPLKPSSESQPVKPGRKWVTDAQTGGAHAKQGPPQIPVQPQMTDGNVVPFLFCDGILQ